MNSPEQELALLCVVNSSVKRVDMPVGEMPDGRKFRVVVPGDVPSVSKIQNTDHSWAFEFVSNLGI